MATITLAPPVTKASAESINDVMNSVRTKNPAEPEFHQAVKEVLDTLSPVLAKHPEYQEMLTGPVWETRKSSNVPRAVGR
jgi:glutamate dehydrogenase (NADP+)